MTMPLYSGADLVAPSHPVHIRVQGTIEEL